MKKTINYLYLNVSEFLLEVVKSDPSKTKDWLLTLIDAVVNERSGVDVYADKIIAEMNGFRQKSAERQKAYRERLNGKGGENVPPQTEKPVETPVNPEKPHRQKVDPIKDTFEFFRKMYGGRKDGLEVEYGRFRKACEKFNLKPSEEVTKLCDAWAAEDKARQAAEAQNQFFPQPKNLGTWLNNLCWQSELEKPRVSQAVGNLSQSQRLLMQMEGGI